MSVHALFHQQICNGPWQVFVVLDGTAADWPEHTWPDDHPVPSPSARLAALASLGYRPVPGAEWEWGEDAPEAIPIREVTAVGLLAAVDVLPIGGAA